MNLTGVACKYNMIINIPLTIYMMPQKVCDYKQNIQN